MKSIACILVASLVFVGCNNSQREEQLRSLANKDSVLLEQTKQKDSTIMSYIHSLNDIQENLESIKSKEKMISLAKPGEGSSQSGTIVADIKALDALIVRNHRELYALEKKLKARDKEDTELKKMIADLSTELRDKDTQIADLEVKLARVSDSLRLVVTQFGDSMMVIDRQKMEITAMQTEINSVYYAVGTYKELKDKGVLVKEGRVIGMGGVPTLKQSFNTSYFTQASKPDLHEITLYAKFSRLVTNHPANSYKVAGNGNADTFIITDAALFWSTSKYLVIIVSKPSSASSTASMAPWVE